MADDLIRADIAAAREADLCAEVERVTRERDDAQRRSMDWQGNYEALALAIVGDTGASAILEAEKLRADRDRLRALLDEAREGLAFYADEDGYDTRYETLPCECCTDIYEPVMRDRGETARATLAKIGGQ